MSLTTFSRASESVSLMVHAQGSYNLLGDGRAERVDALRVSTNALDVLGIVPTIGRAFSLEDGTVEADRVALLTHTFWREWFAADPGVLGTTVTLDGLAHTVVGVLPEGQGIPGSRANVWIPLRISGTERREGHFLRAERRSPIR